MRVIGTAGHVDHGKSTLVLALTGIDPDRLKEEKERQMTIDLGFAWLTLPTGERVGIVDVPGHKDFIKNMLAGVGGIDAALLVVAADEGVMPQTREHLAILDLLEVRHGVVALTKMDLVQDDEWLDLVETDVREALEGTSLASAPLVRVSARTGEGLEALVQALTEALAQAAPRRDLARPRLPVDRAFTIAGFGTVVTGTLLDGQLQVGQEVELQPSGLRARIRGLQSYKEKVEVARAGSRVAVNLGGISKDQIARGEVLTTPGWLRSTRLADVWLRYLPSAQAPLKHGQEVEVFCGSAEGMARVRLLDREILEPGESGWVQLRLQKPMALVRGDRFILRRPSPSETIGGGLVVQPHPPRMHRRFQPEVLASLEVLLRGSPEDLLLQAADQAGPLPARDLVERSGLGEEAALQALEALLSDGRLLVLGSGEGTPPPAREVVAGGKTLVSRSAWTALLERLREALAQYHRQYPLRQGMPREELKSRLGLPGRTFQEVVDRAVGEGEVRASEAAVWLATHEVRFTPAQEEAVERLLAEFRAQPYTPPSWAQAVAAVGEDVLGALVAQGRLVRVSDEVLFLRETYEEMVARVVAFIQEHGSITVAQVRDLFNASRKYALALMEHLDERRITRRVGDERVLR
ncbi:MAG: selenocysteine-specific translation elongation factor [Anaerolineae bacterium]